MAELLRAVGLDVVYERAEGDTLSYRNDAGDTVTVLDALGGYGAGLFGHNHPRLVARAESVLAARRPFLAQGSVRSIAGALAARLSALVSEHTKSAYVVQFGSTGADATESAIKHAVLEVGARIEALEKASREALLRHAQLARSGRGALAPGLFARARAMLGDATAPADVETLAARVAEVNRAKTSEPPVFFALEGAFHGKSTGALGLTYNPAFREPWSKTGLRVVFLPAFDEAAVAPAFAKADVPWLRFTMSDAGVLDLEETTFHNVAACFYEPIQGEGGVVVVPDAYARLLRDVTAKAGVPLVVDEIQSGMGRTGTFLASAPSGVVGDYYLLSKSLGGSLAKISAMLVDKRRYEREFGYLHTSTFVEDDYASAVSLEALGVLVEDDLPARARAQGEKLRAKLEDVKRRHPTQIEAIRGRGLMVGVQFAGQTDSPSPFLRVADDQGLLGYLLAGYLLRVHRVRMAPTLSAPGTLRIQPSAYVKDEDLTRIADAVEAIARLLEEGRATPFARALLGKADALRAPASAARRAPAPISAAADSRGVHKHVAFLGHFLEDHDLAEWDPSLAELSGDECRALLDKTKGLLDPFVLATHEVRSKGASRSVRVTVIGVPFTSSQVMDGFRTGDTAWAREQVDRAVAMAEEAGAEIVGFGGYTSIVTNNCRTVVPQRAALTSGNALTSAAAVRAVVEASRKLGLGPLRVGIVGALGNIGHVLAELLLDDAAEMVLVGRPASLSRLDARRGDLAVAAFRRALEGVRTGLPGALAETPFGRALLGSGEPATMFEAMLVAAMRDALGKEAPLPPGIVASLGEAARGLVTTSGTMDAIKRCNVVLTASNAPKAVLEPAHFGEGRVLVCDVAVPGDVDPRVRTEKPNVVILEGGRVRLPDGQELDLPGMPGELGNVYGCLAETLLLGLEGEAKDFATGALTPGIVRAAEELARRHGFALDEGELGLGGAGERLPPPGATA